MGGGWRGTRAPGVLHITVRFEPGRQEKGEEGEDASRKVGVLLLLESGGFDLGVRSVLSMGSQ